jgi:hypothetical protein
MPPTRRLGTPTPPGRLDVLGQIVDAAGPPQDGSLDCRSVLSRQASSAARLQNLYAIFTSSPVCKVPAAVTAAYTPAHGDIAPPASRRL